MLELRFNERVVRSLAELRGTAVRRATVISLWDGPEHRPQAPPEIEFRAMECSKWRAAAVFALEAARLKPDVILYGHILLLPLAAAGRILTPHSRQCLFAHGIEVWGNGHRRAPGWERRNIGRWIDRVAAVSDYTAAAMRNAYGLQPDRFRRIFCAVDAADQIAAPHSDTPKRGYRLLSVARLSPEDAYKGWDKVILALPELVEAGLDPHYDIVGEGPLRAELADLAESLGLGDRVHFFGRLDERALDRAYSRADVFVMPSKKEGFGIVFLEAWSHGLPVVAGNQDASPEIVADGTNGFTVNPDSPAEVAAAILRLARNTEAARDMAGRGVRMVRERYSHERFRDRLEMILRQEAARCAA